MSKSNGEIFDLAPPLPKQFPEKFFTSKSDKPVQFNPQPIVVHHYEWQLLTLAFPILIIAYVRLSGKYFFRHLQTGLYSRPIFRQLFRDGILFPIGSKFPLIVANLLVLATLFFQIISRFAPITISTEKSLTFQIAEILFIFSIYSISQIVFVRILGFIFKTSGFVKEYLANTLFFNSITTVCLIPLLIFSIYSRTDIILWFAIFIGVFLFLFRIFRGSLITFEVSNYSLYQKYLYLCALEILPVFIVFNILIR